MRLDRFVRQQFKGVTQGWIEKALRRGEIRLDGKKVAANARLAEGQALTLPPLPSLDEPRPKVIVPPTHKLVKAIRAAVITQNKEWIAINKPTGIASQGGSKVTWSVDTLSAVLVEGGDALPKLVHRLDKDTSGLMLLAKTVMSARKLSDAFKSRDMRKCYLAITVGVPKNPAGRFVQRLMKLPTPHGGEMVQVDPKGQSAVTDYRVVDVLGKRYALVALWPRTGRTHQLRVHLAHNETPIVGDHKYGLGAPDDGLADELFLHAWRLAWPDTPRGIIAPPPEHFMKALEILGMRFSANQDPFADMVD